MNRKQMIDFINTEVLPGAEIADWEWMKYGTEIVGKIIKAIANLQTFTWWRIFMTVFSGLMTSRLKE